MPEIAGIDDRPGQAVPDADALPPSILLLKLHGDLAEVERHLGATRAAIADTANAREQLTSLVALGAKALDLAQSLVSHIQATKPAGAAPPSTRLSSVVAMAHAVAGLTPDKRDDALLGGVESILGKFGG